SGLVYGHTSKLGERSLLLQDIARRRSSLEEQPDKFEELGSTEAKVLIGDWKDSKVFAEGGEAGLSEVEEAERQKRASQEHQARMLTTARNSGLQDELTDKWYMFRSWRV
ncbi:hypothetical protein BGX29_003702, partial [Mortierella sp. GBA35]